MARVRTTLGLLTNIDTTVSTLTASINHPPGVASIPDIDLFLVPEAGYTVSASNFQVNVENSTWSSWSKKPSVTFYDCEYDGDGLVNCDGVVPGLEGNIVKATIGFYYQTVFDTNQNLDVDLEGSADLIEVVEPEEPGTEVCSNTTHAICDFTILHNMFHRGGNIVDNNGDDWKGLHIDTTPFGTSSMRNVEGLDFDSTHNQPDIDSWSVAGHSELKPLIYSHHNLEGADVKLHFELNQLNNGSTGGRPGTSTLNSWSFTTLAIPVYFPTVREDINTLPNPTNIDETADWIWEWDDEVNGDGGAYSEGQVYAMAEVVNEVYTHTKALMPYGGSSFGGTSSPLHLLGQIPTFTINGETLTTENFNNFITYEPVDDSDEAQIGFDMISNSPSTSMPLSHLPKFKNWWGVEYGVSANNYLPTDFGTNRYTANNIDLALLVGDLYRAIMLRVNFSRPTDCFDTTGTTIGMPGITPEWEYSSNDNYSWFWEYTYNPDNNGVDMATDFIEMNPYSGYTIPMTEFDPPPQLSVKMTVPPENISWRSVTLDQLWDASCPFRDQYGLPTCDGWNAPDATGGE